MRRIKILTISTSGFTNWDGIATIIFDFYKRFNKDRFDMHLAVDGKYSEEIVNKFYTEGFIIKYFPSRKKDIIRYFRQLFICIKSEEYDAVYIHGSSSLMTVELFASKLAGCEHRIVHSHNTKSDHNTLDKLLRPVFYRLYTDAFACGEAAGSWLFGNKAYTLIRNGRETKKYSFDLEKRKEMRANLGLKDDCLAVGHVGNFTAQKNHVFVLDIFEQIHSVYPNAKLFLMGEGASRKRIEQLAKAKGLSLNTVFTGSINNVPEMLQAMDGMLLPSLHEGLPLVVVEWQIAGLPSLISDVVTEECIFTDLVQTMSLEESAVQWCNTFLELLNNNRIQNRISLEKKAIEAGFDIDSNVTRMQDTFEQICHKGRDL